MSHFCATLAHPARPPLVADLPLLVETNIPNSPELDLLQAGLPDGVTSLDGPTLFAYCFRRFGYPNRGWDEDKHLSCYVLTTPRPDMQLEIYPTLSGDLHSQLIFRVSLAARMAIEEGWVRHRSLDWTTWPDTDPLAAYIPVVRATLRDLSRPVRVRDSTFQALRVATHLAEAPLPPVTGVAAGLLGNDDPKGFVALYRLIARLGDGNIPDGIQRVLAAFPDASKS